MATEQKIEQVLELRLEQASAIKELIRTKEILDKIAASKSGMAKETKALHDRVLELTKALKEQHAVIGKTPKVAPVAPAFPGTQPGAAAPKQAAIVTPKMVEDVNAMAARVKLLREESARLFQEFIKGQRSEKAFESLNRGALEASSTLTTLRKALRDNTKERSALEASIKASGTATEAEAAQLKRVNEQRIIIKDSIGQLVVANKAYSGATQEITNDLSRLTDAGLRFRDKMADAMKSALESSDVFQQMGARVEYLKKEIEQTGDSNGKLKAELDQVSAKSNQFKDAVDRLNNELKEGKIGQKEYRDGLNKIEVETTRAGDATSRLGASFDKFASQQGKQLKSTLTSVAASYIGIGAAIYGAVRLLGNAAKISEDFEAAQSNLSAILGVNKDEMSGLTDQAKQLGATTAFTATQVAEAQTELAKLGFTIPQVAKATPAILSLAAATGTDLANAASIAARNLNAFGLTAEETGRVVDVIALASSNSAVNIDSFAEGMKNAAPAARAVGLEVEEAASVLATLVDNGVEASKAGTDLRNIWGRLEKQGLTWKEAMDQINGTQNRLSKAMELFGDRAGTSGTILADNTEKLDRLGKAYKDAAGTAEEMARKQLDNLKGDKLLLTSAWEGFVLSVNDGSGAISVALRGITQALAGVLGYMREINEEGDALGRNIGTGGGSGIRDDKSLEAFRAVVNEYKLGNQKLSEAADDFLRKERDKIRQLLDVRGKTIEGVQQIREKLESDLAELQQNLGKKFDGSKERAVILAQLKFVEERTAEIQAKAKEAAQEQKKIDEEELRRLGTIGQKREELKKKLEDLKAERDDLNESDEEGIEITDREIAAIESQIRALDGKVKASRAAAAAQKKDMLELAALRKELEREAFDLQKEFTISANPLASSGVSIRITEQMREEAQLERLRAERIEKAGGDAATLELIESNHKAKLLEIGEKYAAQRKDAEDRAQEFIAQSQIKGIQAQVDILRSKHEMELEQMTLQGGDIVALIIRQQEEEQALFDQLREADIAATEAAFQAEVAMLEEQGLSTFALKQQQEQEVNAMREQFRQEDLAAQRRAAQQAMALLEQQHQTETFVAGETGRILGEVMTGRIKDEKDFHKQIMKMLFAAAKQQIQIEIAKAQAIALASPESVATFGLAGLAKGALLAGLIEAVFAGLNAAIDGFAKGGEVEKNGTVRQSWGKPIQRSNGDNVLTTLRVGEKVLNDKQQRHAERMYGADIWARIGLPKHRAPARSFRREMAIQGFAEGGTVGIIAPRPSPQMIVQREVVNAMVDFSQMPPPVVSVQEINQVSDMVKVHEHLSSLG
jgi:hypothetical protein